MGFCGHIGTTWVDDPQEYVEALTSVGGKVMREDLKWSRVEPTLGQYSFPGVNAELLRMDAAMTLAESQGIETLAILDYGNSLYGPESPANYKGGLTLTEAERNGFANYAAFLADALKDRPVEYELWNEWNVPLGSTAAQQVAGEHIDPLKYYALQETVYPVFKESNPKAFLWAGGFAEPFALGPTRDKWIATYLSIPEWEKTVDGFSFHHYWEFTNPEVWFWQVRGIAEFARAKATTKPNLPVALTETGWFNGTDPQSRTEQLSAEYYSRWPFLLRCTGLNKATFYVLRNDGNTVGKEDNFGIFYSDYTPKPAAAVLADILPLIHETESAEYWTDNNRHLVMLDDKVIAFWRDKPEASTIELTIRSNSARSLPIKIAGSTSTNVSLVAGLNVVELQLLTTSKIIIFPDGCSLVSIE